MRRGQAKDFAIALAQSPLPWFAGLSIFLLVTHEPWRDEAEAWLIARDTPNLGAFFQAMRYEGTPPFWHLLLMPLAKLGLPFESARILHAAIAVAGVSFLWFASPFKRWETWLIAFGYYTAYEYDAIARSYALFGLLLFVVAALDRHRHAHPIRYGVGLALLANTALHGLIVAGIVAAAFGLEILGQRAWRRAVWVGGGVATAGFGLAVLLMLPPPDPAPWLSQWYFRSDRIANAFKAIPHAFIPIPTTQHDFWNSSIFQSWSGWIKGPLSILLLAASAWLLRTQRLVVGIYAFAMAAMLALFVVKYYGGAHHAGLLFLLFLACIWMARRRDEQDAHNAGAPAGQAVASSPASDATTGDSEKDATKTRRTNTLPRAALAAFLPLILVLQVVAGGMAVHREATGEFSGSGAVARYLEDQGMLDDGSFITVYHSFLAMGILAQIDDPNERFFFSEFGRFGSFTPWSAQWEAATHMTLAEVLAAMDAADQGASRVILILGYDREMPSDWAASPRLVHLARLGEAPVGSLEERFDVYEVLPTA